MMLLLAAAQHDPEEFERPETFDPGSKSVPALSIRTRPALLSGRSAGSTGGRGRAVGGDGTFSRSAAGRRTGLQAECHAARVVIAVRRGVTTRRMASYCTLFAISRVITGRSTLLD